MTSTADPLLRKIDERLADAARRAGIHTPGRLVDDENGRLPVEFASDDEFLQIAARQRSGRRIIAALAHIHGFRDALGRLLHGTMT